MYVRVCVRISEDNSNMYIQTSEVVYINSVCVSVQRYDRKKVQVRRY